MPTNPTDFGRQEDGLISNISSQVKSEPLNYKPMTFGEKLVGLTFNPSGDQRVNRAKELCAELADLINETPREGQDEYLFRLIRDNAFNEILNAQMNVVKLLTLK